MKVLIRYLRRGPDGIPEAQDFEGETRAVNIGSAADRTIQLLGRSVGARHATIAAFGSKLKLSCARGRRVHVNDKEVRSAALALGNVILIAGHRLQLINPPAGFDLGVEVRLNEAADASEFETAFRTDLDQTWLSKRGGAWILAILTLSVALLIPLRTVILHREGAHVPAGVPDDALWSAGPLIPPHELAVGRNCSACHQEFFVRVQDIACRQCHQPILDHVAKQDLALAHLGTGQRCAQCHAEHDGEASLLAIRQDGLCIACHGKSKDLFGSLPMQTVSGFAPGGAHPAFSVTLQNQREPLATAQEHSNLKFSHTQHLDATRVTRAADGGALGCRDCHNLERNGEHFMPITMERNCASCHPLTFDQGNPSRELPHGKPLEAMYVIEDYFARKYSGDPRLPLARPAAAPLRRLPDRDKAAEAPLDSCAGAGYLCASRRAAAEIENQFSGRGCVSCHTVTQDPNAKDIHDRFQVLPVHLSYEYFSAARFNHRQHAIQKNLLGDEACGSCHNARSSTQSTDVMIPDVNKCLECHRDRYERDKVTMQCVSCHAYHPGASHPGAIE